LGDSVHLSRFTIVRLARLGRITRIVRLLRMKVFKELTLMVNGVIGGLRTLFWAFVLLLVLVYVLAVLLRQFTRQDVDCSVDGLGCSKSSRHIAAYHDQLFGGVFHCMFTVFRCFTDGCSSPDGTPLPLHLMGKHGWLFVIIYVLAVLFILFGIFNLIAAVFVENTLEYARYNAERRHQLRYKEHIQTAQQLQAVVLRVAGAGDENWIAYHENDKPARGLKRLFKKKKPARSSRISTGRLNWRITHEVFNRVMLDPEVQSMMDDLEISVSNRSKLFDVLDSDASGALDISELVEGLMKLRGPADKGDIVSAVLNIRTLQRSSKVFEKGCFEQQQRIRDSQTKLDAEVKQLREQFKAFRLKASSSMHESSSPRVFQ